MSSFINGKAVRSILFAVVPAILASSLLAAPAATAATPTASASASGQNLRAGIAPGDEQCQRNVAKLKDSPEAKQKDIDSGRSVDFYCVGSAVGISPDKSQSIRSSAAAGVKAADNEALVTALDYPYVNRQPGEGPLQSIGSEYASDVVSTIYYGHDESGTANDWIRAINLRLGVGLKVNYHDFYYSWSTALAPFDELIDFNGTIRLQRMEGILPPVSVDEILWNRGYSVQSDDYTGVLRQHSRVGIYSMAVANFHIDNLAKAFSITVNQEVAVPRFLCNYPEQCKYPDMQEAPIF